MEKLTAASIKIIVTLLSILTAAFVVNAVGQVTGKFAYDFPPELIALCQTIFGASTAVWSIGWIAEWRAKKQFEDEKIAEVSLGKDVVDAEEIPAIEQSILITDKAASKYADKVEHLDNLYPPTQNIEVSIMEVHD